MAYQAIGQFGWHSKQIVRTHSYRCGYCSDRVASEKGYKLAEQRDGGGKQMGALYLCPNCNYPTLILSDGTQLPGESIGADVQHVPDDVEALYNEARRCSTEGCHTAAVLVCRKILMNLAVGLGATQGLKFIQYVEFLAAEGYVPPKGKHWVDHIRLKGNEATHEIHLMGQEDSRELLIFIEMLLRFIYEFPSLIPPSAPKPL